MGATDVTETLDEAIATTGVDQVKVKHRPRPLSDNGPAYLSGELREAVRGTHREIKDQEKNDRAKKEGVPGPEGGLGEHPKLSLSKRRSLSRMSCRRTLSGQSKWVAGDTYRSSSKVGVHIHGGLGYTAEADPQLDYTPREDAAVVALGSRVSGAADCGAAAGSARDVRGFESTLIPLRLDMSAFPKSIGAFESFIRREIVRPVVFQDRIASPDPKRSSQSARATGGRVVLRASLTAVLALAGCVVSPEALSPPPAPADTENVRPTYSWLKENVFMRDCMFCHVIQSPYLMSYEQIMGTVSPGEPLESRLYLMVRTGRMPKGGRIADSKKWAIYAWILNGAHND